MNDMKKYVLYLIVAAAVVLSWNACQKSGGEVVVDDSVRTPVLFGSSIQSTVSTKGAGALDAWGGQNLYIYGLRRVDGQYVIPTDPSVDYDEDEPNAYLIKNVKATAPTEGLTGSIEVHRPGTTEYFYYRESTYYDFYGYYVDNAAGTNPAPTATSSTISLDVTIDGSQDVMIATTDKTADASHATSTVDLDRVYGAYAARRQVKPNLIFDHQLSSFKFTLVAGNAQTETNVTVQSLKVYSKSKGQLIIASNDAETPRGIIPDASQEPVEMNVISSPMSISQAGTPIVKPIMVMPGASVYKVELVMTQTGYSQGDGFVTTKTEIDFSKIQSSSTEVQPDNKAVSGHQYDVTLKVYGLEEVKIDVTMSTWDGTHGQFEIDPDE